MYKFFEKNKGTDQNDDRVKQGEPMQFSDGEVKLFGMTN